jgi:tetratricopeptide (TPR) repeat protein
MSHAKSDQEHLRSACGYVEQGMFQEAQAELEEIDPLCRHLPEILATRIPFYRVLKKWDLIAVATKMLAEWKPNEPGYFIAWAYATRRAESIHAAHAILTRAAGLHPTDAIIQFNLACYESQSGNLDRANAHLTRATEIDDKFGRLALDGPDLEPLWDSLATEQGT